MASIQAVDWRGRAGAILQAIVVIICYVIVFAGLLFTVAGAGTQ